MDGGWSDGKEIKGTGGVVSQADSNDDFSVIINGVTALHDAAQNDHASSCGVLLRFGAKIEAETADGQTPLRMALAGAAGFTAPMLLQNGASLLNALDRSGEEKWLEERRRRRNGREATANGPGVGEEEEEEEEKEWRRQRERGELIERNAVLMKEKIAPFLDEEEAALLNGVEGKQRATVDRAMDIHYACGWKGEDPSLEALMVGIGFGCFCPPKSKAFPTDLVTLTEGPSFRVLTPPRGVDQGVGLLMVSDWKWSWKWQK